jgi:hypothetical protein
MAARKTNGRSRGLLNAIFVTPGDPTSGLLPIDSLTSAQTFVNRYTNGSYVMRPADITRPTEAEAAAKFDKKLNSFLDSEGVVKNADGSYVVPEVLPSQGNGYDAYGNAGGFLRKDVPYALDSQALAKYGIIVLDALHTLASAGDNDAINVLATLRVFDSNAAVAIAARAAKSKYDKAKAAMVDAGMMTAEEFDAANASKRPTESVEPSDVTASSVGSELNPAAAAALVGGLTEGEPTPETDGDEPSDSPPTHKGGKSKGKHRHETANA